jgi:thiamine biosynthesis protein ThiS
MARDIEITVNGVKEKVPENSTVSELIAFFEENDNNLVVELNKKFIYFQQYSATFLTEGDIIESIHPDFGG